MIASAVLFESFYTLSYPSQDHSDMKLKQRFARTATCLFAGMLGGAIPALPLMMLSTMFQDRPAFWLWPVFGLLFAVTIATNKPWRPRF